MGKVVDINDYRIKKMFIADMGGSFPDGYLDGLIAHIELIPSSYLRSGKEHLKPLVDMTDKDDECD